jgi:large subunit ribosomal protein L29|tara:strand:- start:221 stop:532 length:312 start_codon:yes stop_codon:yes gene_type:complete
MLSNLGEGSSWLGGCQTALSLQNDHTHSKFLTAMKISEIKELSAVELQKKHRELGDELLQLQIRKQTGQVEKPHLIKSIRRDRARIRTLLNQPNNNQIGTLDE